MMERCRTIAIKGAEIINKSVIYLMSNSTNYDMYIVEPLKKGTTNRRYVGSFKYRVAES